MLKSILQVVFFIAVGALIFNDFFPHTPFAVNISTTAILFIMVVTIIASVAVPSIRRTFSPWSSFRFKLILTIYVVALITGFTLIGGSSTAGFDLYSPLFIVLVLLQTFLLINEYRRLNRKQ
ncbi:hypothetical protein [Alteribacillus bidgolensis]|uniref:Uncharacterized protein n=1 Tax=Alteribacillus bidgolensis TaxID=930129 RepID=A0A1G8KEB6_9BACI|nr:hypothetical protein [Alteribacillus bidgolensis]SDI41764.1 hypothetical protein SAMN05216352_107190 [Alteribacillus bidgolensis]